MKELTSSYDDVEKRMAIFLGLGAMLFTSLYLFTQGADLYTYLVRGVLALILFTVVGWGYGHWLRSAVLKKLDDESLPENVERQSRDVKAVEGRIVTHSEAGEAVIPAEHASGQALDFTLPELEPFIDLPPPSAGPAARAAVPETGPEADLPPPPVPSGI